jgi:propionate CoA-transferase
MDVKKLVGAREALSVIKDGDTVAVSGFNLTTSPEYLVLELFEMYKETGHPNNLFIISDTLPAVPGRGFDKVFEELYADPNQTFIRGTLMPFIGWSPALMKLTLENRIEVYSYAIGTTSYWFREIASGRPGLITKVGLGTFLDPRIDGGASNELGKEKKTCKVELMNIDGEEWLRYNAPTPDVTLVRGTTGDMDGNISMEEEGFYGTVLNMSQAAKAMPNPGKTICQIKYVARKDTIPTRDVIVPAPLVDYMVVAPDIEKYHKISGSYVTDPRLAGTVKTEKTKELESLLPTPNKIRDRIVAGRILIETMRLAAKLKKPLFGNLGIGIPTYVSWLAGEFGYGDLFALTVEPGPVGGIALVGQDFGVAISPNAIIPMPDMFTNYEGSIIDFASLGFMELDPKGNVNPSYSPVRVSGPGGFPVISAGSPRTYFAGGFTAGKFDIDADNGKLIINEDGNILKFNDEVVKIVFSGPQAVKSGKEILYVTERAVFGLDEDGLVLQEVAPGVDVDKDILAKMSFKPKVASKLEEMPASLFYKDMAPLKEYTDGILKEAGLI